MTIINESLTAKWFTPGANALAAFRLPRTFEAIMVHHWGDSGQKHENVSAFFVRGDVPTSPHFVASAGKIDCLVSPADIAWHAGNAKANASMIGIECRPEASDEDYATVAELIRFLRELYGPLPLVAHRDVKATVCPGIWDLVRLDKLAKATPIKEGDFMRYPLDDPRISQFYGSNPTRYNPHPIFGNYQPDGHTGIDFACAVGTPIKAVAAGKVVHVGWFQGTYANNKYWIAPAFAGYCYVVEHWFGFAVYAHGQEGKTRVSVGQQVSEGQIIGLSGNTGGSTGPHLHFEILRYGFVVSGYMYGRSDPTALFTTLSVLGDVIKEQENDLGTLEQSQFDALVQAVADKVFAFTSVQNEQFHNATRQNVADRIFNTLVDGVAGDKISLGQFLSEYRSHVIQLVAAVGAAAASDGASVSEIEEAVRKAMGETVIDVKITGEATAERK